MFFGQVHNSKTMSLNLEVPPSNGCEKVILSEEQHMKVFLTVTASFSLFIPVQLLIAANLETKKVEMLPFF